MKYAGFTPLGGQAVYRCLSMQQILFLFFSHSIDTIYSDAQKINNFVVTLYSFDNIFLIKK